MGPSINQVLASGLVPARTCSYARPMIGSGRPDTFSWRTDFPPSPGHIILEADSISCPVGQNFLGKCVSLDTSAWRTDFPPTTARIALPTRELVKFYCDVITRSRLQLINTSIDTFFRELRTFLADQRRTRKANDG